MSVELSRRLSPPVPLPVGYVMTHYPRTAQTFISGEIDSVERAGIKVACFAMNRPGLSELGVAGAQARQDRTFYLKDKPMGAALDAAVLTLRHPLGMILIAFTALASAGGNPQRTARRIAHLFQAARLARSLRARDLVHLHAHFGLAPTTIAWLASRMLSLGGRRVGFSFTIHGFHDFADPAETRLDLKVRAALAVVCVSDFTRSQLCLHSDPALWPRFQVIRCGIDLELWAPSSARRRSEPLTIVAIGRLAPEKGFAVLLEALANLRDAAIAFRLRLIGEGPDRVALAALIERLRLTEQVTLAGELPPDAVRAELQQADIFCLPSFSEGLPVSIMEAMASGVPVVSTAIAGIPELAEHGVTALTVPPARADALASALERMIDEPQLAADLVAAARVRVERQHDLASNGRAIADLFRKLTA